jgi:murein DD-endopeptidase MepM/ murein hydrolase activator NlpD
MGVAALVTALVLHMHAVQARQAATQPVWPAQGTITSPFGRDGARWHPGIDIGTLRSLKVRAAVPGRVVLVGPQRGFEGYGNVVLVRSRSYLELYGHLASWQVREGERVRAGDHIATAGCTGFCTGTHLHFEVRRTVNGKAFSPFATVLRPLLAPVARRSPRVLVNTRPKRHSLRTLASAARKPHL